MLENLKHRIKGVLPERALFTYRALRDVRAFRAILPFLRSSEFTLPFSERIRLVQKFYIISLNIDCPHTQEEMLGYVLTILTTPSTIKGCFVEAGCYKGGSTAKFSLVAKLANRRLVVFDSFEGIPENDEPHDKNIFGGPASFEQGDYCGTLDEVKANLSKYGNSDTCELTKGWFEDTMPNFRKPIAGIYLDIDLASSTRTCLKYLYPLLEPGGVLYSQDGHLPLVIEVFNDDQFWENVVGCQKPHVEGLGERKLIKIVKRT